MARLSVESIEAWNGKRLFGNTVTLPPPDRESPRVEPPTPAPTSAPPLDLSTSASSVRLPRSCANQGCQK
ncbi:MAG: hypothetical protein IPJ28_16870 [Betaproteobacteria bacterium]|nr:hypothetical protein [Betaproteobacteria bacterium]